MNSTYSPSHANLTSLGDNGLQIPFAPLFIALSFFSIAISLVLLYAKLHSYYFGAWRTAPSSSEEILTYSNRTDNRSRTKFKWIQDPMYRSLIPEFPFTSDSESSTDCSVCLTPLASGDLCRRLPPPCSHTFHSNCILEWFAYSDRCPLCKRSVLGMLKAIGKSAETSIDTPVETADFTVQEESLV